jgi:adenylate kinase
VAAETGRLLADMGKLPTDSMQELPKIQVGLTSKVDELVQKLQTADSTSHMLLLHGMGGIGKTTIAKGVCNQLHGGSPELRCSFVQLEFGLSANKMAARQRQLLRELASTNKQEVDTPAAGRTELASSLRKKKILLVLDNVWDGQLEELLPENILEVLGEGSMVLVTSRDAEVAKYFEGTDVMEAGFLSDPDDMQLLCQHAYSSSRPPAAEEGVVRQIVKSCGGLPMALEVVGRHLSQCKDRRAFFQDLAAATSAAYRKDTAVRRDGERTLFAALQLSWKALQLEEQEALLDIVWFLNKQPWGVLEPCCGYGVLDRLVRFGLAKKQLAADYRQGEVVVSVHDTIVAFSKDCSVCGIGRPAHRVAISEGRDDEAQQQVL